MAWNLDNERPIYAQLVERLQLQIISGKYPPGTIFPGVRELAAVAAVNPNTVQKSFAELEKRGWITAQGTNGRSVTENAQLIQDVRRELAERRVQAFFEGMEELGYTKAEALELLENIGGAEDERAD